MDMERYEEIVMTIIGSAGEAKSYAFDALRHARKGDFAQADEQIKAARSAFHEAHHIQTELISAEAGGDHMTVTLLMVHAQDHLMTALLAVDLIAEMIEDKKTKA